MSKTKDNIVEIKVDEDIIKFLKYVYFGDLINPVEVASNRAYRDMCRTIRFGNFDKDDRVELKKEVNGFQILKLKNLLMEVLQAKKNLMNGMNNYVKKQLMNIKNQKYNLLMVKRRNGLI